MAKTYYKGRIIQRKKILKIMILGMIITGAVVFSYTFFPLISWQIYFAPVFASQKINAPIPTNNVINTSNIGSLLANAGHSIGSDYTNAYNWYPGTEKASSSKTSYTMTIPKIEVIDAKVSNEDMDLTKHMVQYNFDTSPPNEGNSIIFGHSSLPQLYNPNDYKTILANAYKLSVGDEIFINMKNVKYKYKIENIIVVDPMDTSVLSQNFSDSFLTIITCTPPGTVWKRLVIKARIQKI